MKELIISEERKVNSNAFLSYFDSQIQLYIYYNNINLLFLIGINFVILI